MPITPSLRMQTRQRLIRDIERFVARQVDGAQDSWGDLIITPLRSLANLSDHDLKLLATAINSDDQT